MLYSQRLLTLMCFGNMYKFRKSRKIYTYIRVYDDDSSELK